MQELERQIKEYCSRIGYNAILAGIEVFIIGFLVHMFIFVNHYPTYSGLNLFINDGKWHALEGRWFAAIVERVTSVVTIPTFIGVLSLLFWAVAFVCVVKIFGINSIITVFLAGIVFIAYPVIGAYYTFLYTSHCFALGSMMSCLGCWYLLCEKGKRGLLSIVFFTLAVASYQAVLSIAMAIIFVYIALKILDGEEIGYIFKDIAKCCCVIIISLACYYITFKGYLAIANVESYRDFHISLSSLLKGIIKCYGGTYWFIVWGTVFSYSIGRIIVLLMIGLTILISLSVWINRRLLVDKRALRFSMLVGLVVLFPIIASYAFLVSPDEVRTYRQFIAYIIVFILPIIMAERYEKDVHAVWVKVRPVTKSYYILLVTYSVIAFLFFSIIDNIAYMNMHLQYEREYSLAVRLVDRIENTEGYTSGMPVIIIMKKDYSHLYGGSLKSELDQYIVGMEESGWGFMHDASGITRFIEQFIQTDVNICWDTGGLDDSLQLKKWPQTGSTCIFEGKLYIYVS